ncbi:MAG TPA: hypothetical protein DCS83_09830 [Prevotella sp.]|nr:hypothetical protein [Prevotella sp.]
MSRLSDLYKAMETLRKEGLSLNEDLEHQVTELEENIIKKEILPTVIETIAPALKQVQRELVLVVEYKPGMPISVALSRKTNITELLDAKVLEMDPQVEHRIGSKRMKPVERKNGKTILRVTFPDGTVVEEKKAKVTFANVICRIGLMRVRSLDITFCGVPIVSNTIDSKYGNAQIAVENGLYVMTHSSTHDKKKQLDRISDELNIGLKVEEI